MSLNPASLVNAAGRMNTALSLALVLAGLVAASGQTPTPWPGLAPGPFAVGFRSIHTADPARTWSPVDRTSAGGDRPIQIAIWYPAEAPDEAVHGAYRRYAALGAGEGARRDPSDEERARAVERYVLVAALNGAIRERVRELVDAPTLALIDGKPAAGPFPLLLYAPSFSAPSYENAVLCELLASHGYVVAASPSMGYATRNMTADQEGVDSQVRDLEFVLGTFTDDLQVDRDRVGAFGFSWGGLSNVVLALKNGRVRAVLSLDGSVGYQIGLDAVASYGWFRPERLRAPFLQLTSRDGREWNRVFYEDARYAAGRLGHFARLDHLGFSADYILKYVHGAARDEEDDRATIDAGYRWICRLSVAFFDAALKSDDAQRDFLDACERAPAEGVFRLESRPALAPPASGRKEDADGAVKEGRDR